MPRFVDHATFQIAAKVCAKRVVRGRMRYSDAEIGLLMLRAGAVEGIPVHGLGCIQASSSTTNFD